MYQKLITFLILCSLWIGPKRIWVGKRPKRVCQSLTLNFWCLFTFNLVSFHASSRIIQVNLLHAEVSYIIYIACHWSFFPILPVLATFWIAKTTIFSIFQLPIFAEPYPSNLCSPMLWLDYWAKTRYRPILRHCVGAVSQYLAIFYENLHKILKSWLKTTKISTKSAMFQIQEMRNKC